MYTLFSFTAVVAFGDGNIFAKISWQTFDRYFDCKVISLLVTAIGVVCCRKLFYSKESRRESAITSSVKSFRCLFVTVARRFSHGRNVYKLLPKEAK